MFQKQQESRTLVQYYADFSNMYEELKVMFHVTSYVKQMQLQHQKLAVLTFLGGLNWVFHGTSMDARRINMKSLPEKSSSTEFFSKESHNPAQGDSSEHYALTIQLCQYRDWRGRGGCGGNTIFQEGGHAGGRAGGCLGGAGTSEWTNGAKDMSLL